MAELKPYPKYKDSGIEWIGEIPEDWDTVKLKYLCKINTGSNDTQDKVDNGSYPFFVRSDNIEKIDEFTHDEEAVMTAGDGVGVGKVFHYYQGKFSAHQRVYLFTNFNKIIGKFLYYYVSSNLIFEVQQGTAKSTVDSLRRNMLTDFIISLPDIDSQSKIVQFIDKRTSQINSLIADKERLIELLEEKRQAVITETVTKGLDTNVKMKDSGIEWIGEIPEHWQTGKIKYFSEMKTGATPSRNKMEYWQNGTINWMTSGEINQEFVYNIENKITELGYQNSSTYLLPVNTVLIALNGQGKTKGKAAVLKVESTCNQSLVGFICDETNLHYLYLYYFLKIKYRDLRGLVGDGLRDGISLGLLKTLHISLPDYVEQLKIVNEISLKDREIVKLINDIETQITKLQEYRESLIYEAVTGKIDLRDHETDDETEIKDVNWEDYGKVAEVNEPYQ